MSLLFLFLSNLDGTVPISLTLSLSLSLYIYIYIYICKGHSIVKVNIVLGVDNKKRCV